MVEGCSGIEGVPLPNCSEIDSITGQDAYPKKEIVFFALDQEFPVSCINFKKGEGEGEGDEKEKEKKVQDPIECPEPLLLDLKQDPVCAAPCPLPIYSYTERLALKVLNVVGSSCSLVLDLIVFLSLILDPTKRKFPSSLPIIVGIPFILVYLSHCITFAAKNVWDPEELACKSPTELAGFHQSWTAFYGAVVAWGFLVVSFWWVVVSFILFYGLVLQQNAIKLYENRVLWWCFNIYGWGYGSVIVIILTGLEEFSATGFTIGGFISNTGDLWLANGTFWIPLLANLCIGTIFIYGVLFKILRQLDKKVLWRNAPMLLWLVYFVHASWVMQAFNWVLFARFDDLNQALVDWVNCSASTLNGQIDDGTKGGSCGPIPDEDKVPYGLLVAFTLIEGFTGCVFGFAFFKWSQVKWMLKLPFSGNFLENISHLGTAGGSNGPSGRKNTGLGSIPSGSGGSQRRSSVSNSASNST